MPADPDMLTSWLTHQTNQITKADAIQRLHGVSQRYDDLAAETDATAIQGLLSECMTADELTCFVMTVTGTGLAPYVVIVHYTENGKRYNRLQKDTIGHIVSFPLCHFCKLTQYDFLLSLFEF